MAGTILGGWVKTSIEFDPLFQTTVPPNIDMTEFGNANRYIIPIPPIAMGWKTKYISDIYNAQAIGQTQTPIAMSIVLTEPTEVLVITDHEIPLWELPPINGEWIKFKLL